MKLALYLTPFLIAGAVAASTAKAPSVQGVTWLEGAGLPYETFEVSVDHVDLDTCPAGLDTEKVFCRMTLASEQANVFIFSYEGDQPLLGVKHYPLGDDFLNMD